LSKKTPLADLVWAQNCAKVLSGCSVPVHREKNDIKFVGTRKLVLAKFWCIHRRA